MAQRFTDIGAEIKVVNAIVPVAAAAGTVNGSAIDRSGFRSAVLFGSAGADSGSPSAFTLNFKLQESADGSTGWADISGAAVTTIEEENGSAAVSVNLLGAMKYIRVVAVAAFTGGTTPTIGQSAVVVLGGGETLPTSY